MPSFRIRTVIFRDEIDPISSSANSASTEPMQPSRRQCARAPTERCPTVRHDHAAGRENRVLTFVLVLFQDVRWAMAGSHHAVLPPIAIGPWGCFDLKFFAGRGAFMLAGKNGPAEGGRAIPCGSAPRPGSRFNFWGPSWTSAGRSVRFEVVSGSGAQENFAHCASCGSRSLNSTREHQGNCGGFWLSTRFAVYHPGDACLYLS